MTLLLKQSTAKAISFGPFVDITDGSTLEVGLVSAIDHATTGIMLSKNGGALTIRSQAVTASTYDIYGNYIVTLSTTDTNTLGTLRMQYAGAAPLPVFQDFLVVPAMIYDSIVAGTDVMDASVTQWLGTAAATPTVAGVPEVDLTHVAGATTNVAALATNVDAILTDTADMQPKLGTPAGASISADLAAIEAQTDDIGAAGAGLTAVPWNAAWDAEVQSEVDDALVVQRLDELVNADSDIDGAAPPTVGSVVHELMSKTAGSFTYDQTTDSLEAIRDNEGTAGAGLTDLGGMSTTMKAQVETEVDDALGGGTGTALTAIPWNAAWDAEVESEVDDALGAGTGTALTAIPWNAAWDAEVESEVDDALGAGTGTALTAVPWNAAWDAEVQSEVADALAAFGSFGIKKNTAKAGFAFVMTDSTNHVPTTGYTVTAERMLDGGTFAACANAVVEDTAGWYHIDLAAADLNGDTVALKFTATGADALNISIVTSP